MPVDVRWSNIALTNRLCGNRLGRTITSSSFNFYMRFSTDETISNKGFNISIQAIAKRCNKVSKKITNKCEACTIPRNKAILTYIVYKQMLRQYSYMYSVYMLV